MFRADPPPAAPELSDAVRDALREVYRRVDAEVRSLGPSCWIRGDCCDFDRQDHVLYASSVEVAHACAEADPGPTESRASLCPFWVERRCRNREGRPLGCRTYFCDPRYRAALEAIHERWLREVRKLSEAAGGPWAYSPFPEAVRRTLAARASPRRATEPGAREDAGPPDHERPRAAIAGPRERRS